MRENESQKRVLGRSIGETKYGAHDREKPGGTFMFLVGQLLDDVLDGEQTGGEGKL